MKHRNRIAVLFLVSFALAFQPQGLSAAEHTKDSLEQVQKALSEKTAVLLDVREMSEWTDGHLQAASSVPLSQLREKLDDAEFLAELRKKAPRGKVVYCHCARGRRALSAADLLAKLGYDVRPLKAGYNDLIKAGFVPAEEAAPALTTGK